VSETSGVAEETSDTELWGVSDDIIEKVETGDTEEDCIAELV
jgi:hypothetical protein